MHSDAHNLTTRQFDILDLLHALDADRHPVLREHLALNLGDITPEACHCRMLRYKRDGLVDILQESRHSPASYEPSELGRRLYRAALLKMDGVTAPPEIHESLQRALEATTLYHLTEPRTMHESRTA